MFLCCIFFWSQVSDKSTVKTYPVINVLTHKLLRRPCQYHPTSQFLVVTQEELSQIHPSLTIELKHRGSTQRCSDWSKHDQSQVWPITARRVVSVQWRSVWPVELWTFHPFGPLEVKEEKETILKRGHRVSLTQKHLKPAIIISLQQFETGRSSPTCTACGL